jgi:hypothetical protein
LTADELIASVKKLPNPKDTMEAFLSELRDVGGWITINKPYKKTVSSLKLDMLLEDDEEYAILLDTLLRKKHEEILRENFDISYYDFLTSAYLERKVPYEEWEFRKEFEDVCKKYQEINNRLEVLLRPLYKQLEERKKELINKEESDSFINLALPNGTIEILVKHWSKTKTVVLTPEIKRFIEDFLNEDSLTVVKYRVVKKPSIFNRIGKRLGLCI